MCLVYNNSVVLKFNSRKVRNYHFEPNKRESVLKMYSSSELASSDSPGVVQLGELCDNIATVCPVDNAICRDSVCQCNVGFVQAGPLCVQRSKSKSLIVLCS